MNKVTKANVDVQHYPFTTKSLFVGHCDHNFLRWQIIDSPGILDRPLEARNTIEMQAITALAHLHACLLFFMDLSPLCAYPIEQQCRLFASLSPLFASKPVIIVLNKVDLRAVDELTPREKAAIDRVVGIASGGGGAKQQHGKKRNIKVLAMSNREEIGIFEVRNTACDLLLSHRIHVKAQTHKLENIEDRLFIAQPVRRDDKERRPVIPTRRFAGSLANRLGSNADDEEQKDEKRKLARDLEKEHGGPGVFVFDRREHWNLKRDEWKYDPIPEIYNGKNVADYYAPDVGERLAELEAEEARRQAQEEHSDIDEEMAFLNGDVNDSGDNLNSDDDMLVRYIRRKMVLAKKKSAADKSVRNTRPTIPRTDKKMPLGTLTAELRDLGINTSRVSRRVRFAQEQLDKARGRVSSRDKMQEIARSQSRVGRPKERSGRSKSRVRSHTPSRGISSVRASLTAQKLKMDALKALQRVGRIHESDRHVYTNRPKFLNVKRKSQFKSDWR